MTSLADRIRKSVVRVSYAAAEKSWSGSRRPEELPAIVQEVDEASREFSALMVQVAALEKQRKALTKVVEAWQSLPGDRHYTPKQVERWLAINMKPAIDDAVEALGDYE